MKYLDAKARERNRRYTEWGQRRQSPLARRRISSAKTHLSHIVVKAPKYLNVTGPKEREHVLDFLASVDEALKHYDRVHLCFNRVEQAYPCGTLLFRAKLDTWLRRNSHKLSMSYPENDVVEELFQHIGILQIFKLQHRKESITHDQVRHWHYHTGAVMDPAIYKDLTISLRGRIVHPHRELFADCLNEAVYNTVNHAYDFEIPDLPHPSLRNWWMFSQVKDGMVTVVILDLGVSIPRSLLRKPEWRDFLRVRRRDGMLIETAVCSPRTSTSLAHRGKGLPEMLEFSQNLQSGGLRILSRRGIFSYNASNGQITRDRYRRPIPGTLVSWAIPLSGD